MADITQPVTPYREGQIDHDDPNEWSREPAKKPLALKPQKVRANVDFERKANHPGQHPIVRKQRRPELQQRYLSEDMIRMAQAGQPPHPEFEAWIRDIIEPGVTESLRGHFAMAIDPAFRRWTLYQRVATKSQGTWYVRLCIFSGEPTPGRLPADLAGDPAFAHLRGSLGDFKVPTRRDFEMMRERWDRRNVQGREVGIREGATSINNGLNREQAAEYDERNRVMNDRVRDMLDYNFRHIWRAANDGMKLWSNENIVPHMNPDRHYIEQRQGYVVRAKKGTRMAERLAEEAKARELAPVLEADARAAAVREFRAEVEREAHLAKTRALMRGHQVEEKRRRKSL